MPFAAKVQFRCSWSHFSFADVQRRAATKLWHTQWQLLWHHLGTFICKASSDTEKEPNMTHEI